MKISGIDCARIVRDSAMDAMDALNEILTDIAKRASAEEQEDVRRAIAMTMDAVLVNLVNPVLRDFPELDVDEETWGEIALTRARIRCSRSRNAGDPQEG